MSKKLAVLLCLFSVVLSGCSLFSAELVKLPDPSGGEPAKEEEKEKKTLKERAYADRKEVTDTATILGKAQELLQKMTLEEKIGQMFIVNLELLDDSQGSYYEFRKCTKKMKKTLKKYPAGGVILFARNIEKRKQVLRLNAGLQEVSPYPLFVTVDEEGGDVARIGSNRNMKTSAFPPMEEVGKQGDAGYAQEIGETIGRDIASLGFNVDFAPVADINTSELNEEIGNRSFGSDTKLVSDMVEGFVEGIQSMNVSATLKHFPGQGSSTGDTHKGAVNLEKDITNLRKTDFKPFKQGIKAGADFIMVSHISVSRVTEDTRPASMSEIVMKNILRTEFEYEGVIVTDAMDMAAITSEYTAAEAAVSSIQAGADIVLMPQDYQEAFQGVIAAVKSGTISEEQINESVERILQVKVKRGLFGE